MKKCIALTLALALILSLCAPALADGTRTFTDSVGRTVTIPEKITKIAVTGPLAQIVVFAIAPDLMIATASEWDACAEGLIPDEYFHLPELGQLYGGKGDLNLESLLSAAPEVIIDVGEPKGNVKGDLDALSAQSGIPFIHITATTDTMAAVYRTLGELLGKEEKGEALAAYYDRTLGMIKELAASVEKRDFLYITGAEGHNVIAQGSYQSEIIDLMTNNLAVLESPSSRGTGNEVDMEQILTWSPEYIIFSTESIYADVASLPEWQTVPAIANGNYWEAPQGPYNWMGFPPSVQRLLGLLWMGDVLYPDDVDYDLYEEVKEYFSLFYHTELSREQFDALMVNSARK